MQYFPFPQIRFIVFKMILVAELIHLVKLVILSGFVKREQPVSLILVANPEAGKTLILSKFSHLDNISYKTDLTAFGIYQDILEDIEDGTVTHIVIPDLIKPLSRKSDTVKNFITFLSALIEEGYVDMSIYFKRDKRKDKSKLQCGLITAITKEELFDRRHKWIQIGFMSRPLPASYSYSLLTQTKIREYIKHGKHLAEEQADFVIPPEKKDIRLPYKFAHAIEPYTIQLASPKNIYGFRYQRQFQALLKASAMEDKRKVVTQRDINKLSPLLEYVNLEFKPI